MRKLLDRKPRSDSFATVNRGFSNGFKVEQPHIMVTTSLAIDWDKQFVQAENVILVDQLVVM